MSVALLPCAWTTGRALEAAAMDAVLTFSDDEHAVAPGGAPAPGKRLLAAATGRTAKSHSAEQRMSEV